MAYKILINKNAVPVLIEVPKKPLGWNEITADIGTRITYEQALSTALADESKHIAFKDDLQVWQLVVNKLAFENKGEFVAGQIFDLPENISVSFEKQWRYNKFAPWHEINGDMSGDVELRTVAILTPLLDKEEPVSEGAEDNKEAIFQGIETMMFSAFMQGQENKKFKDWYERNGMKESFHRILEEYSQAQRLQARNEAIQECIELLLKTNLLSVDGTAIKQLKNLKK